MADHELIVSLAKELRIAEETGHAVEPLSERHPELTVDDAYAVQLENVRARLGGGDRVVGHKAGLTSVAMQRQLGVDEPDFGHLLASQGVGNGGVVDAGRLLQAKVELEIGFLIGAPLEGPGVTVADILAVTTGVFPTLEIIDSRIADWRIRLVDTVADAASGARFVLPSRVTPLAGLDLRVLGGIMEVNGRLSSWSCGAAALGDPLLCVAWLANLLARYGGRLEPGHVVLSGALAAAVPVAAGDVVTATFDRLGTASVRFDA
jgi:2-keto-4-pentenoate hydratase